MKTRGDKKMERFIKKIISVIVGTIFWILFSAGHVVYAQNFTGVMQPESTENTSPNQVRNVDSKSLNQAYPENPALSTAPADVPQEAMMGKSSNAAAFDDSTYTLGEEDVIEVTVARHPEVSKQYIINNEGKIQYEFVGDIQIAGLTKKQARDLIVERLSTYIVSPEVTLKIVGYNSKVVYVIGEVGSPGKIYMRGDTITVRDALLEAGLPLLSASTRRCPLITPADYGKAEKKYVDVFKLIYEGDLRENLVMKPGDTLYVPATVLAKAMRVIQPVTQPVREAGVAARPIATGGF